MAIVNERGVVSLSEIGRELAKLGFRPGEVLETVRDLLRWPHVTLVRGEGFSGLAWLYEQPAELPQPPPLPAGSVGSQVDEEATTDLRVHVEAPCFA